jgi:hypothetical protein
MDQLDCFCGGRVAVISIHDLETVNVEMMLASNRGNPRSRTNKNWNDNTRIRSLYRPT